MHTISQEADQINRLYACCKINENIHGTVTHFLTTGTYDRKHRQRQAERGKVSEEIYRSLDMAAMDCHLLVTGSNTSPDLRCSLPS